MKPICFMVMPFGIKEVAVSTTNAPAKVDFDALWQLAFKPAIISLGYEPIRADQDIGALIIHEMLERLFFADLVLADMTLPNGNVYYEIGVRHAAKKSGCVLIAADWARPLFDTQQMRRLSYALPQATISASEASAISKTLIDAIPNLALGNSPMYDVLPGYPNPSRDRATTLRKELLAYSKFTESIAALKYFSDKSKAKAAALEIAEQYPAAGQLQVAIAVPVSTVIRDYIGWEESIDYISQLPDTLRNIPTLQEQLALARSKSGKHEIAIAAFEMLIALDGDSSERRGLIGGRYKRLATEAKTNKDLSAQKIAVDRSIDSYENGMRLELGDYYCVSNLARLYRMRGEDGDESKAQLALQLTILMTQSAIEHNTANEWARPTLLGAAFDARDEIAAGKALKAMAREGAARWKLQTTLSDIEISTEQIDQPEIKVKFAAILDEMKKLI